MTSPVLTGSTGPISGGNVLTVLAIDLGPLTGQAGCCFDATSVTVAVANDGTSKTINAASLVFTSTVGAQTVTVTVALSAVSIASGASQVFQVSLTTGYLPGDVSLSLTFASAPTAGSASALLVPHANH